MRISNWSSDVCSSDLMAGRLEHWQYDSFVTKFDDPAIEPAYVTFALDADGKVTGVTMKAVSKIADFSWDYHALDLKPVRSEEHTSELQSLMRISYAVFCLKTKTRRLSSSHYYIKKHQSSAEQ